MRAINSSKDEYEYILRGIVFDNARMTNIVQNKIVFAPNSAGIKCSEWFAPSDGTISDSIRIKGIMLEAKCPFIPLRVIGTDT